MEFVEIIRKIPVNLRSKSADKLIDLILNSQNASKLQSKMARAILQHWQADQLTSDSGLSVLLDASMSLEPQKTLETFSGLDLTDVANSLRSLTQS